DTQERERDRRQRRARRYAELLAAVEERPIDDEAGFSAQRHRLTERREQLQQHESELQNQITEWAVALRDGRTEPGALSEEIVRLRARRSNIPKDQVLMRAAMCRALGFDEESTPFAGELIQVREDVRDWEGAIERVLHNFGLSLLVPDSQYAEVS